MLPKPPSVEVIELTSPAELTDELLTRETPWIARGLVGDWPLVEEGKRGGYQAALNYLLGFYQGRPITAFIAEPHINGRFFYNDTLEGFNFTQVDTTLDRVSTKLDALTSDATHPALYVGSTNVDAWLPGFRTENDLPFGSRDPLMSLWLGNKSRVAAHFDYPRNIACCALGTRTFTVFPPEQLPNLYIGPWDLTPAGQPICMVDFHQPDLARFPKFEEAWSQALIAELLPGDALYLPGMWWHHVEATEDVNILINYWWSDTPAVLGSPTDAFNHALLSLKSLPPAQKAAWRTFFEHYVFADDTAAAVAHLPEDRRGRLGVVDDTTARRLRAELTNRLKR